MKIKLPLYLKILGWFFLNLVFLGVIFLGVARVQFRFGLDSLVAGPAGRNVQNVIQLLSAELRDTPGDKWNGVLNRFSDNYHVQFYLYRGPEQLAGAPVVLPREVRERLPKRLPMNNLPPRRPNDDGPDDGPPDRP